MGILIGFYIRKLLFCAAWRVIVTGRQQGCGSWIILAILESGFTIVRSPYFLMEETMRRLLRGVDDIASTEDLLPLSKAHFRCMLNRLKNKHTATQIAARHQQVFQHRELRRMNNITVAKAAAAEPALPQRSHAEFCSEFPDLSNEYLSLMNVDTQRADIELQQRKEDLQDDIRLLTEAAQHLRAEKVASCHIHPPDETPGSGGAPPSTKTNPDKLSCQHEQMHQPLIGLHAYPIHDNHGARELFSISSNVLSIGSTCSFQ
jgi:hypothetical protein